jgi:Ala-tRNA(Pro) deacylase
MELMDATRRTPMNLAAFLADHGIDLQRFEHPPVMTVEESERLVPRLPGAKTKNLFLRDKKGARHFLVTVPLHVAVDLGITPGSVSLPALINDRAHTVEFVIDRRLWDADAVHAHPLTNDVTMVIPHAALERFLAATGHSVRIIEVPTRITDGA